MQESEGIVERWDDQKGFGFIVGDNNKRLYFHISAMRGSQRPVVGDKVLFVAGVDTKGRPAATHVRHKQLVVDDSSIRVKPLTRKSKNATESSADSTHNFRFKKQKIPWVKVAILLILPIVGVTNLVTHYGVVWGYALYLFTSLLAYYFYWDDKRRAKHNEWRVTEANLHFWSLVGGWPGAFIAQQQFRHKTKKLSFQLVFWLIVLAHQMLWIDWLFMDGQWLMRSMSSLYN